MISAVSKIDRYFAEHGGKDKKYLCASEVEPVTMKEVLSVASEESLAEWEKLTLCLNDPRGHPTLRQQIAELHDVSLEDVMVAVPQEAIYIAMNTLSRYIRRAADENIEAIVTFPTYQSLHEDLRSLGVTVKYWRAEYTQETGWNFDVKALQQQITSTTRLLVVNFPNNPTGFIPNKEVWDEVISLCREHDIFLFSDEMYRLSNNDASPPLPSVCSIYTRSMLLFGMSKTFGMPGLRTGWICCTDQALMDEMMKLRDYITGSHSVVNEHLTSIALQNRHFFLQRSLQLIHANLTELERFFCKHQDIFEWRAPSAGSTCFVRVKGWLLAVGSAGVESAGVESAGVESAGVGSAGAGAGVGEMRCGATGFCDKLRRDTGILLLPASIYDVTDEFVRVGFGRSGIQEYLQELEEFIRKNKPVERA